MDTAELLKKVRKIEIKTKGMSKHLFSGDYHSAFKGRGMSFSEVREYQFGDDVRNIDWNVTARTGDPYVKIFEEEREITVMLLIDVSRSLFFGTRVAFLNELITEVASVLSFSAIQNNDKVGVILFSDHVEMFIPPKKGKQHILRIIRELVNFEPVAVKTDIGEALRYFSNVVKKRSICFVMSDYIATGFSEDLRVVANKHDLIGVRFFDELQTDLPKLGLVRMKDAETGKERVINASSQDVRKKWKAYFEAYEEEFNLSFRKAGADTIELNTGVPYIHELHRFFKNRIKRQR